MITIQRFETTHKSEDPIYIAAEAWNHATLSVSIHKYWGG